MKYFYALNYEKDRVEVFDSRVLRDIYLLSTPMTRKITRTELEGSKWRKMVRSICKEKTGK